MLLRGNCKLQELRKVFQKGMKMSQELFCDGNWSVVLLMLMERNLQRLIKVYSFSKKMWNNFGCAKFNFFSHFWTPFGKWGIYLSQFRSVARRFRSLFVVEYQGKRASTRKGRAYLASCWTSLFGCSKGTFDSTFPKLNPSSLPKPPPLHEWHYLLLNCLHHKPTWELS